MSGKIHGQVYDYVLTHNEQTVLQAFAESAHHDGTGARPSIARVVWMTGLSERTVQRVIRAMKARGVLDETRPPGHHRAAEYRILFGPLVRKAPFVSGVHMGASQTPIAQARMGDAARARGVSARGMGANASLMGASAVTPEPYLEPFSESSPEPSTPFSAENVGHASARADETDDFELERLRRDAEYKTLLHRRRQRRAS